MKKEEVIINEVASMVESNFDDLKGLKVKPFYELSEDAFLLNGSFNILPGK